MAEYTHNENLFEAQTSSLMDRLQGYFDDISLWSRQDSSHFGHLFKFRSLVLLAEMYEYVRFFFVYREARLSEYFSGQTLCQSLEKVAFIEKLQDNIRKLGFELNFLDTYSLMHNAMFPDLYTAIDMFKVLHEKGIDEFCEKLSNVQMPSVNKSVLWVGDGKNNSTHNFERVFRKAKENFDEHLGKQIVRKVIPPEKYFLDEDHAEKFNFREFIVDMQQKANEATVEDIYVELFKALEMLRNVFMTDAEDIYYVRTGDFTAIEKVYDKEVIEHFYTKLPLKEYYEARSLFIQQMNEDMEISIGEWRISRGYIGRKLTPQEQIEFLQERKDGVIENMKSYEELWKLRMHSGGLDADVTPENFARMFYRRKGVDRYFIELQWELEELTSLIAKNKQKPAKDSQELVQTPEQKAVADFVDSIIMLVNTAYEKWNNQRVVPAVHKAEVHIVIKKEELIKFMQDKMKNDFEELCEFCYPEASKQDFCQFVAQLQNDGYFGALPNKLLAEVLAPIAKISVGTARNYLSQS